MSLVLLTKYFSFGMFFCMLPGLDCPRMLSKVSHKDASQVLGLLLHNPPVAPS